MRIAIWVILLLASPAFAADDDNYRLPAGTAPTSQAIQLIIDPSEPGYTGKTTIELTVSEATDKIALHQLHLEMTSIVLASGNSERVLESSIGDWDINWLTDGNEIEAGDYTLTIEFSGSFSTDALGMYKTTFEEHDYVFTQMEAMYARRAFPIFDEPAFKIPYQLTIIAPDGLVAIANEPVKSSATHAGWTRTEFKTTPPLPSYLIAYAVGTLDRTPIEGLGVPAFVYMPTGYADEAGFVVRETPTVLATLEEYFGLDYPFRKLDFIAVPDFAFGAMENPGLITYRTDILLVGDEVAADQATFVLMVLAHELAHIWYGDLVTMSWWDDLWLNEAFASWMAWSLLEDVYPQYESNLHLPQESAFPGDQRVTAEAIRRTVRSTRDALASAGLNYTKGSALLTMLENYVGAEVWQSALRNYIDDHAWGSATEQDLWAAVADESGLDVSGIAGDFLNQPGYAQISIDSDGQVTQQRYLAEGAEAPEMTWTIPLDVKYKAGGTVRQTFLLLDQDGGTLDIPSDVEWVFPDAGGNGYYRWQTSVDQLYDLVDDIDELSNREKIALLGNTSALLDAGEISLGDYMYVLKRFGRDPHPLVFLPVLEKLIAIGANLVDASNREAFGNFMDETLGERYAEVGAANLPDDTKAITQLRPRLLRALGQFGTDPAARASAARLANEYLANADLVSPGLAREALRVTALNDDGSLYEAYQAAYLASTNATQKSLILSAVYFDSAEVIQQHLDFSISDAVPSGDARNGIRGFAAMLDDQTAVYAWLDENQEAFIAKLPASHRSVLPQVLSGSCVAANLVLLQNFFGPLGEEYAESLAKAVESEEACINRRARNADDLQKFLAPYAN